MKTIDRAKHFFGWRKKNSESLFPALFERFQDILKKNNEILEIIAGMGDKLGGAYIFDRQYIFDACQRLEDLVSKLVYDLNALSDQKYISLYTAFERVRQQIQSDLVGKKAASEVSYVISYNTLSRHDLAHVGSKNANIAELKNVLEYAVPDGFAVTVRAFFDLMDQLGLADRIKAISDRAKTTPNALTALSEALQQEILNAEIPFALERDVRSAIGELRGPNRRQALFFAVRSSATEEDTAHSFAGQYKSFLNVPESDVLPCYKKVLASAYAPRAWQYRLAKGFEEHEIAMAAACQLMVRPKCSGVLYTMDPVYPENDLITISATWGLAVPVVEGTTRVDEYLLTRDPPHSVHKMNIVHKDQMMVPDEAGGVKTVEVPASAQDIPCLSPAVLNELARIGYAIERYYKRPQDIEWACDQQDNVVILQTRPLQVRFNSETTKCTMQEIAKTNPVILSQKGNVVQRGIAYGKVFKIEKNEDLNKIPSGAIVVAKKTSPRLSKAARIGNAILTDVGSATGHMATVAREFRIPTIVNMQTATEVLKTGDEVTVDASENTIYEGIIKDLCYHERTQGEVFEECYEYRLLNRLLLKISPLNLVDPHDESFRPERCRTLHDIVRFVHEKAVDELMHISARYGRGLQSGLKPLQIEVPLGLYILDIGDGVIPDTDGKDPVTAEAVKSLPLKAFLMGLVESGLWATEPVSIGLKSMMASVTRTFSTHRAGPDQVGRNLVVASENYMNLNLRLGYHFNIIDAYIGDRINDNYGYFRFVGGVTEIVRRSRRVSFIAEILNQHDFRTEIRGDLVIGRLKKLPQDVMRYKLALLGALVSYTRQLDVLMHNDERIHQCIFEFNQHWPAMEA
jgi:pyruvate,water dikinase